MISYEIYKLLHLVSIFLLLLSLGGLTVLGADRAHPLRRIFVIGHGVGLFLILIAGFGLLARTGVSWPFPGWVFGKLVIWLVLGVSLPLFRKRPEQARQLWLGSLILAALAVVFVIFRPF